MHSTSPSSRPAALLVGYRRGVCALLAPCAPGAGLVSVRLGLLGQGTRIELLRPVPQARVSRREARDSTPNQTRPKPTQREGGIGSWKTSTPHRNCSVGAMYWRKPSVESGTRLAAAAKQRSGIAVTGPQATNSASR